MARNSNYMDQVFLPVDGVERNIKDFFQESDFITDNGTFVKHDGLLKACKKIFRLIEKRVHCLESPTVNNGNVAVARVTYVVRDRENGEQYVFESLADCCLKNQASPPGSNYYTAMAETRASGRALRFLLGVDFCTKEEVGVGIPDDELISPNVVAVIEKKFLNPETGITIEDVRSFLDRTEQQLPNLNVLTSEEGAKLMQHLNKLARKKR